MRITRGGLRLCHELPLPKGDGMEAQKSAEGIVGRWFDPAEGPNMTVGSGRFRFIDMEA